MDLTIQRETPAEFFREMIEHAIAHQNVETNADTAFYLTQLLESFVRPDGLFLRAGVDRDQSLAELYCEAVVCQGRRRLALLKLIGDLALFISGFFPESLNRKTVGTGYYVSLGGGAYGTLSMEHRFLKEIYAELAVRFALFADVLSEVSERCSLSDASDVLRLYERWLDTGSGRSAEILRQQGILVVPGSREVH